MNRSHVTPDRQSSDAVHRAIDGLYDTFGRYPVPARIEACPCCLDEAEKTLLLSKPLRQLEGAELVGYTANVFLTVGAIADFLYFLPRILEICAEDEHWPDPEIVLGKLPLASWTEWPAPEQAAVREYCDAVFAHILATDETGDDLDSWLCALARGGLALPAYLAFLQENKTAFLAWYHWNSAARRQGRLANPFWESIPEEAAQVMEWLASAEIQPLVRDDAAATGRP
ncbi:MAG: hypothetical protein JXQ27_08705 [Acidobacteria bacterium]|nr:hypothetical protein [Acidobacteriota bacterium]